VLTIYPRPFTPQDHEAVTGNMLMVGVMRAGRATFARAEDAQRGILVRTKTVGTK
jgi:branched-chain amino acid transport system substrate-binding protein